MCYQIRTTIASGIFLPIVICIFVGHCLPERCMHYQISAPSVTIASGVKASPGLSRGNNRGTS